MFKDEVSADDRRKALSLRIAAARPPEDYPSEGHRRLADVLDRAPRWLLAGASREMFEDLVAALRTDEQQALAAFAAEAGLEPLPFALSGVSSWTP